MSTPATAEKPHYHGHYQRLRERFLRNGLAAFEDYEALELLLSFSGRNRDVKPLAKDLIKRFGSFKQVLDAPAEELAAVDGMGPA